MLIFSRRRHERASSEAPEEQYDDVSRHVLSSSCCRHGACRHRRDGAAATLRSTTARRFLRSVAPRSPEVWPMPARSSSSTTTMPGASPAASGAHGSVPESSSSSPCQPCRPGCRSRWYRRSIRSCRRRCRRQSTRRRTVRPWFRRMSGLAHLSPTTTPARQTMVASPEQGPSPTGAVQRRGLRRCGPGRCRSAHDRSTSPGCDRHGRVDARWPRRRHWPPTRRTTPHSAVRATVERSSPGTIRPASGGLRP